MLLLIILSNDSSSILVTRHKIKSRMKEDPIELLGENLEISIKKSICVNIDLEQ